MRHLLFGIPILISAMALVGAAGYHQPEVTDGNRAIDAYEAYARFFGLNPTNSADVYLDFDGDRLSSLQEFAQLTDPFASDTDRDGFEDDVDANPISRAYIQWGAPQFTTGDFYDYAHPDWFLAAYKNGGEWIADQSQTSSSQSAISNPQFLREALGSLLEIGNKVLRVGAGGG
ncbi:MAG: hypothetical protein WC381_09110 [Kiritimatiellia bacterium]